LKHVINPRNQEHWAGGVGSFILNFGAIEAETVFWIRHLRTSMEPVKRAVQANFARRVAIVREHLDAFDGDPELKAQSVAVWEEALDLATFFRNKIAHSPLVLSPDLIGFLEFRSARGEKLQFVDTIDKAQLNEAIDDAARIAQRLLELRERLAPDKPEQQ
jgi:hypothetical protein